MLPPFRTSDTHEPRKGFLGSQKWHFNTVSSTQHVRNPKITAPVTEPGLTSALQKSFLISTNFQLQFKMSYAKWMHSFQRILRKAFGQKEVCGNVQGHESCQLFNDLAILPTCLGSDSYWFIVTWMEKMLLQMLLLALDFPLRDLFGAEPRKTIGQ